MTPSLYAALGTRLTGRKRLLWRLVVACLLTVAAVSLLAGHIHNRLLLQWVFSLAVVVLMAAWGLLLSVYWFSPDGRLWPPRVAGEQGFRRAAARFSSWYSSVFLSVWFLVCVTLLPWSLWHMLSHGLGQS